MDFLISRFIIMVDNMALNAYIYDPFRLIRERSVFNQIILENPLDDEQIDSKNLDNSRVPFDINDIQHRL